MCSPLKMFATQFGQSTRNGANSKNGTGGRAIQKLNELEGEHVIELPN
jgi:hypothetical protein